MKIFLAVPTFETIYPDTFKSLWGLERAGNEIVFDFVRGYDCATARNNIALRAIEQNADFILTVDNDMVIPSDALVNLLEDAKDVCLGYYAHRESNNIYNGKMNWCKLGEFNYTDMYKAEEVLDLKNQGQKKILIHGGGMGCALIKTSIFPKIPFPYYDWVNYKNKHMLSEDLYFCEACRKANIPIWGDVRVGCGHILRHVQWPTAL